MYKNLLILLILLLFTSCSAPKPQQLPAWYTSPPSDFKNFYVVASDKDVTKAKKLAIKYFRDNLNRTLDSQVNSQNSIYQSLTQEFKKEIISNNYILCNKLSMRAAKIDKQALFQGKHLVLLSISREELFKQIQKSYEPKMKQLKELYSLTTNEIDVKKYFLLKPLTNDTALLLCQNEFKATLLNTYDKKDDFNFLTNIQNQYLELKNRLSFYVLSDGASIFFAKKVKEVFLAEGLKVSRAQDENTFKILISSSTQNTEEYEFKQAKSLVQFITYDYHKNKIAFKKHTFIGKSRKSFSEAKQQSALHLKYKMGKIGIFKFIGL